MKRWIMVTQVLDATRFLSRLPLPEIGAPEAPLATTLRAAPIAGLLIATAPALTLWLGARAGLTDLAAAALAVTVAIAVTGALHEDGLADVADGFGGGSTVSRKLAIMRDSRIGAFGALAIGAALIMRVAALQALLLRVGPAAAALALMAAASLSRGLMLVPLALLRPARPDGLAHAAVPAEALPILPAALPTAGILAALLAAPAVSDRLYLMAGVIASAAAALAVTRSARHHIRGVTGDVIGATQQITEITFLLVLCVAAGPR